MSEPGLLQSMPAAQEGESLWEKAPVWRNLIVGASALTLAALALPFLPAQEMVPMPQVALAPIGDVVVTPAHILPAPVQVAALPPRTRAKAESAILPQAAPQPAAPACALRQPAGPFPMGLGTIVGFESQAQSLADIPRREARLGGAIDPAYVNDLRATVRQDDGRVQGFDVPQGMTVQVGDRVTLQNSYRNQSLPCSYVPILIAADSGPASPRTPQ